MLVASQSPHTTAFSSNNAAGRMNKRPSTKDGEKQAIWIPMLNSASKGEDMAEKQLLILGGTATQQRDFLEQLNPKSNRPDRNERQKRKQPPISNRYSLGYTYHHVLDADQEDIIARINVYMLSNPSSSFAPLLSPLITPKTASHTLITILLDWSDPFKWARQLRQWIRLLRSVILSLDDDTKIAMEENMTAWKSRKVGPDAISQQSNADAKIQLLPLSSGEWDEGLGIPITVVCIQSEHIENLERNLGWQDEQWDFLMQWLRCVLLKHGASLIYTASFDPNNVRTLIHSNLNISSLLKRDIAKPNYLDRDKILIPPNWDSWGKMRVLRESTDLEAISDAWSIEIQRPAEEQPDFKSSLKPEDPDQSAVAMFESTLPNPHDRGPSYDPSANEDAEVTVPTVQEFLQTQHTVLEALKAKDEKSDTQPSKAGMRSSNVITSASESDDASQGISNARMAEHIGPYQINVSGIEIDAEEATRRLRERESERGTISASVSTAKSEGRASSGFSTPTKRAPGTPGEGGGGGGAGDSGKTSNEAMSAFFANLIKKDRKAGTGSGAVSPTRTSSATDKRRGSGE